MTSVASETIVVERHPKHAVVAVVHIHGVGRTPRADGRQVITFQSVGMYQGQGRDDIFLFRIKTETLLQQQPMNIGLMQPFLMIRQALSSEPQTVMVIRQKAILLLKYLLMMKTRMPQDLTILQKGIKSKLHLRFLQPILKKY